MSTEPDSQRSRSNLHDDEDDDWIPLVAEDETEATSSENRRSASVRSSSNNTTSRTLANSVDTTSNTRRRESLESIQQRLESRKRLREGLVEHPINRFYRRFLVHFAGELWNQEGHVRVGLILVAVGSVLQFFVLLSSLLSCWYFCFRPRVLFLLSILVLSFIYLANINVEQQIETVLSFLSSPSALVDRSCKAFVRLQLRWILLFLLLVPTFLETRTLAFLSGTLALSGWILNCTAALLCLSWMLYQFRVEKRAPRDCTMQGMLVLYGSSLLAAITVLDVRRIHVLGGPFLMATGSLLLSNQQDESRLSRAVRHALRLSLCDVLATLGETVQEDEMLQLAMIRWIVDYWAYTSPPTSTVSCPPSSGSGRQSNPQRSHSYSTNQVVPAKNVQHQLEWSELLPMLNMTTDQMEGEIHETPSTAEPQRNQSIPSHTVSPEGNGSLANLKTMLASMNVDEHAKPAVMSYKQAVEGFPPSRRVAECLVLVRRCPAVIALLFLFGLGSPLCWPSAITLIPFFAFEVLRVRKWANACRRVFGAAEGTAPVEDETYETPISSMLSLPREMDSMCIILSEDNHSVVYQAPLLQVWTNVCSSVAALETGLTAARCVHTTAVAADFAGNIMSLAQFGVEVSKRGWLFGVAIMLQELIHLHSAAGQTEQERSPDMANNTRYTTAIVSAFTNGDIVARNIGILLEEVNGNPFIEAVVGCLTALVGRGWLWGNEGRPESRNDRPRRGYEGEQENRAQETASEPEPSPQLHDHSASSNTSSDVNCCDVDKETSSDTSAAAERNIATQEANSKEQERRELSFVLERLAAAYEQGLIVESEKDSFMLMLANSGEGTKTKRNIEVVRSSLECVFKEAALQSEAQGETGCRITSEFTCDVANERAGESKELLVGVSQFSEAEDVKRGHTLVADEGCGLARQSDVATESLGRESNIDSGVPFKSDCASTNMPSMTADDVGNDSSEVAIAQVGTQRVPRASLADSDTERYRDERHTTSASRGGETSSETDGDHWLKLAGVGLGVVGAVIGGLAVAARSSKSNENQHASERGGSQRERATPYIEEIGDDETDEWESLSESNNNTH